MIDGTRFTWAVLDEQHRVVPTNDAQKAEEFLRFETEQEFDAKRRVARTATAYGEVSTIFLCMNYGWRGTPLWFETMVFGGPLDNYILRYETWAEAAAGHLRVVRRLRMWGWWYRILEWMGCEVRA